MNNVVFFLVCFVILLACVIPGLGRRSWRKLSFEAYAAAPNEYGWLPIALTISGTIIGGGMFLAVGRIGYEAGVAGFVVGATYLIGLPIVGVYAERIRRMMNDGNYLTLIDVMSARYGRTFGFQFCLVNALMYFFLLAGQFVAIYDFSSFIRHSTGSSITSIVIPIAAIISLFVYPIIGGLRKDINTDIIQMFVILLAGILILVKLLSIETLSNLWSHLPEKHITGQGYGVIFPIGAIVFYTPSFFVRMDIWQRIKTAKSDKDCVRGFWVAGILSCLFFCLFSTVGMWAYVLKLPSPKWATLNLLTEQFREPVIIAVIVGAFFAAVLSSADTFINNSALFATKLILPNLWRDKQNPICGRQLIFMSRILGLLSAGIALIPAYFMPSFIDLLIGAFSILLIYLPAIVGILIEDRHSRMAANWSSGLSLVLFLILFFGWNPKLAFIPAVFLALILFALLRGIDKKLTQGD